MTKLFLASELKAIESRLEKEENWMAIIDSATEIPKNWKSKIFLAPDVEKLMFQEPDWGDKHRRDMVDWFKAWPNKSVMNEKSLKQLLEYQGTSLWWLGETVFFKNSFKGYISFKEVITRLEALRFIIQKHEVKEVHIYGNGLTARCAKTLCQSLDIKCVIWETGDGSTRTLHPQMIYKVKRIRGFVRGIVSKINKSKYASDSEPKVLAMSYYMSIREDKYISKEEKKEPTRLPGDMMLYPVLK